MRIFHKYFRRSVLFKYRNGLQTCCGVNSRKSSQMTSYYDVVISGGGMVGTAMAAALGHDPMFSGQSVLLLEAGPPGTTPWNKGYSSRVCALSPGTKKLLSKFGAWENITNMRYQEVKRMQVWDACSESLITFNRDSMLDNLAYIVENDIILAAILEQAEKVKDNLEIRHNSRVKTYLLPSISGNQPFSRVELEDGDVIETKLLIGADGYKSLLRDTAQFHTVQWDYNQMGLVATLKVAEDAENNVAWQRFLKTGPIAMLPLSSEYSCLIWTTTPDNAKNLIKLPIDSFVDAVNHAFWSDQEVDPVANYVSKAVDNVLTTVGLEGHSSQQLPPTVIGAEESSRAMFPLSFCHSSHYVKSRVALIGDAAHRVHPLAGQGVNLGFGDVACLADKLSTAVYNGQDIGAIGHLLEYESERQRHVIPTMATVDGLNRLYSTAWTPLVLLRSLGLQATNALRPIKDQMMKHAMQ